MKKVILNQNEIITIDKINNKCHVGFIDDDGYKGFITYVGTYKKRNSYSAISMRVPDSYEVCNTVYGKENFQNTIQKSLEIEKRSSCKIIELYVFETRKELFKWLSE